MQMSELLDLKPNQKIIVVFAQNGKQEAVFLKWAVLQSKKALVVKKWRSRSGSWTKPVKIYPDQVLSIEQG